MKGQILVGDKRRMKMAVAVQLAYVEAMPLDGSGSYVGV